MELSPQAITGVDFQQVRKGYDPEEVKSFLAKLATGLEEMRSHLVASDARARAAMARVQELSSREPSSGDTEVISKTLLTAQRTADSMLAEANRTSTELISTSEFRARTTVADAETRAGEIVRSAELQARNHTENELRGLVERRAALQDEVDRLNEQIVAERERVAAVIESLQRLLRSPEGLGTLAYRPGAPDGYQPSAPVALDSPFAAPPVRLAATDDPRTFGDRWPTGEVPIVDGNDSFPNL